MSSRMTKKPLGGMVKNHSSHATPIPKAIGIGQVMAAKRQNYLLIFHLLTLLLVGNQLSFAQDSSDWIKIGDISLKNPTSISLDGKGHLFVADANGNIHQFDRNGDVLNFYSPVFRSKIQELEAFWTVSILAFTADMQQAEILDRFLNPVSHIRFSQEGFGMVSQANLGNGNVLWLIDEAGLQLVKFDYRRRQKLQEQPLSLILPGEHLTVLQLLERKNTLFLLVENLGVFILDNQANPIKHIPDIPNAPIFVKGDLIFAVNEGKLFIWDFIKNHTRQLKLPQTTYQKIAVGEDRVFFLHQHGISIYEKPLLE
jgi:hypothetical protein